VKNSIEETIKIIEDFILKTDVDYSEYNEQIVRDISYQAIQHLLSEYKKALKETEQLKKENEELKQDRKNNYQMIALSQQGALGYMQGYEDGKKSRRSAIANIVENQQYYIFNKQMEKCKKYIEKLQKENEQLRTEVNGLKKGEVKYE
jgi:cell division protein FtsB